MCFCSNLVAKDLAALIEGMLSRSIVSSDPNGRQTACAKTSYFPFDFCVILPVRLINPYWPIPGARTCPFPLQSPPRSTQDRSSPRALFVTVVCKADAFLIEMSPFLESKAGGTTVLELTLVQRRVGQSLTAFSKNVCGPCMVRGRTRMLVDARRPEWMVG